MSARSAVTTPFSSGRGLSGCWSGMCSAVTSRGGTYAPEAMAAATEAMFRGLASTLPCPIAAEARSVSSLGSGNSARTAGTPGVIAEPKPKLLATSASRPPFSRATLISPNVVLQECANAFWNDSVPKSSKPALWNGKPPMFFSAGHDTRRSGRTPSATSAEAVTTLNVEPGGYLPSSARLNPPGALTTARISPVEARSATRETGLSTPLTAWAPARCTFRSMVVWIGR